ncbi:hypothetical protein CY0110_18887 [Crocosphaera chwakensis CCY0110]|uniref:Uncharacterized protein n=1 Tax=Crocosphaera chwakensis CCY0110 TaxID=391612 RepID=A3IJA9_9CHRO|nr:hypothetical protein CY0110_18887 [Crocosphaera chwakensis CCY0110]
MIAIKMDIITSSFTVRLNHILQERVKVF